MIQNTAAPLRLKSHKINLQLLSGIILGASVLMGGVYFLHPLTTDSTSAANTNVAVTYNSEDWTISAPTSTAADAGGLEFDIEGNPAGVNMAKKDTVTSGSTNVPDYQIYVSVNTEGGKIPATSGDAAINATAGTVTDKTDVSGAATLSTNSWGYALSSFSSINYNDLVSDSKSSSWSSSKWSKLPYVATYNLTNDSTVEGTAAKIYDSKTDTTGSVDIYYGINANNDLASGEYQTTVTYTLIGEIPATPIVSGGYMHEITSQMCADSVEFDPADPLNTEYKVVDARTNEEYWVRKFGNLCWMVENLYLPAGTTISTANNYSKVNFNYPTTSSTSGWSGVAGAKVNDGVRYRSTNSGNYDGSYFNWYTATAGTGGDYGTDKAATSDICPTNWRLPTYAENGTMNSTISSAGGITAFYVNSQGASVSAILPGLYGNSSRYDDGSYAYWWSSTQFNANRAYRLCSDSSSLVTGGRDKNYGFSVRCVLPAE